MWFFFHYMFYNFFIMGFTISKFDKLDSEILKQRYLIDRVSQLILSKEMNCSVTTLRKALILFDMPTQNRHDLSLSLTAEEKSVILGGLLGDACIPLRGRDAIDNVVSVKHVNFVHSIKQKEYVDFKFSILKRLVHKETPTLFKPRLDVRTNKFYQAYGFKTFAHPIFDEIYDKLYIDGHKTITQEYLNEIDDLALSIWWNDDGTKNKRCKQMALAVDAFSLPEIELIQKWLLKQYSIESHIVVKNYKGKQCWNLTWYSKNVDLFTEIVRPYTIPSMEYKIKSHLSSSPVTI